MDVAMGLITLLFQQPLLFVAIVLVFLVALSVHEFSHAAVGYALGDLTAKRMNRLTLNPLAHIDPWGFLALVFVGFGWGKPVPYNPYHVKYPRWGPVLIAAAGPASNFLLGALCALALRLLAPALGPANLLVITLGYAVYLNFILMLFNLIPLPPLDGSKAVLAIFAHEKYRNFRAFLETQGATVLLALVFIDIVSGIGIFSFLSRGAAFFMQLFGIRM
jgi:Zn-dependent protease